MSGLEIQVLINDRGGRRPVAATVEKSNKRSVWVRLRDGNLIKRSRMRDIVGWTERQRILDFDERGKKPLIVTP